MKTVKTPVRKAVHRRIGPVEVIHRESLSFAGLEPEEGLVRFGVAVCQSCGQYHRFAPFFLNRGYSADLFCRSTGYSGKHLPRQPVALADASLYPPRFRFPFPVSGVVFR